MRRRTTGRRAAWGSAMLVAGLVFGPPARAQESVFALQFLGVSEETGDGRARSLGVLGVAVDDAHTAIVLNPAALAALDQMTLSAMLVAGRRNTDDGEQDHSFGMARFPHVRAALPLFGKVVFSVGFNGFVNARGEFLERRPEIDGVDYVQRFDRDGTLYTIPLGLAANLGRRLRVGATLDVLLGRIEEEWVTEGDSLLSLATRQRDTMSGQSLTLGAVLLPWRALRLGASWNPEYTVSRSRESSVVDTRIAAPANVVRRDVESGDITFPQALRAGASLTAWGWSLHTDALWREWTAYDGSLYEAEGIRNEVRVGAGIEHRQAVRRLAWRLGVSRHQWPRTHGGAALDEHAVHAGFGVDLSAAGSRLDVALERAWIGNVDENGLGETAWRVVVSISGQETWKRKSQ